MPRVASDAAAHIGRRIAAHRVAVTLTQDELAAGTGIDSSNIPAYESGRAMPSVHTLVRIALTLGVEPGDLIEGLAPEMFPAPAASDLHRAG